MNERRPPAPHAFETLPVASDFGSELTAESTVHERRPDLSDQGTLEGDVFHEEPNTAVASRRAPGKVTSSHADISLVEARELPPSRADAAPVRVGENGPPRPSAVVRLPPDEPAQRDFSAPGAHMLHVSLPDAGAPGADHGDLPLLAADEAEAIDVKKWKAGVGRRVTPLAPADASAPARVRPGVATHIDIQVRHSPADLTVLRSKLEEAEQLLRAVQSQAAGFVSPGARGMHAQLTAALVRLEEALALLGR